MHIRAAMLTLSVLCASSQAVKAVPVISESWTPYGYEIRTSNETNLSRVDAILLIQAYGLSSEEWWRNQSSSVSDIQQGHRHFSITDSPNGDRIITGSSHVEVNSSKYRIQKNVSLELTMNLYGFFSLKYRLALMGNRFTQENSAQSDEVLEIFMKFNPYDRGFMKVDHELHLLGWVHTATEQRSFQGTESEQWIMEGHPYRYVSGLGRHQLTFSGTLITQANQYTLQGTQFMGLSLLSDWTGTTLISGAVYFGGELKSPQQQQFFQESLNGAIKLKPNYFVAHYDLNMERLIKRREDQRHLRGYQSQGLSIYISPWGDRWMGGHHQLNLVGQVKDATHQKSLAARHDDVWSTPPDPFMPPIFLASQENGITLW